MTLAVIQQLGPKLMRDFYFAEEPKEFALKCLAQGRYKEVGPFDVCNLKSEDATEELFNLTNNPSRQAEREQVK